MREDSEVLVAGAGPVGLFAAHALTRAGLPVRVVDNGIWACAHTYALALHPRTVELLRKAGFGAELLGQGWPVRTLAFYDQEKCHAEVQLSGRSGQPIIILPQSVLEAMLEKALSESGIHVRWRHRVVRVEPHGDTARVHLNRYE